MTGPGPELQPSHVRAALEHIRQARPLPDDQVWMELLQVRQHLGDLKGGYARLHAVRQALASRLLVALGDADLRSQSDTLNLLIADFAQEHSYRQNFSLLYYRFIRADLGLEMVRLAELVHYDRRTLQRRCNEGIQQLTFDLIGHEIQLRQFGVVAGQNSEKSVVRFRNA
ncbi:MAG: hypothetical protein HC915_01260 [Anaerolineae bacterium]|nr:hypothetical protein [Anaerolineae bacterium]